MADVASIVVRIITEKKGDAGKDLEGTAARVDGVSKKMQKLAVPAAVAAGAVIAFGKAAADSASRTQQAMGAVDSVFGRNAAQIKKWAAGSATSVGLASSQYAELATVLGSQLKNMGLPLDQVAGKTDELIRLGADLAATYGGTTAEAVQALSSTLRGETDPIERYGVSINQAAIAAKQAQDGTAGLEGEAGKQAKTMATLALVSQQTADAQGQFAEESDSAAGQAQIASAQYENMKSALGTALLPAIAAVTGVLGTLAAAAAKHPKLFQAIAAVVLVMAAAIMALSVAETVYTAVTTLAGSATLAAWIAVLWPILLVIAAVAAVIAIIVILWKKSETFRTIVLAVWSAIKTAALATWGVIRAVGAAVFAALSAYVRAYLAVARAVFSAVTAAIGWVSSAVSSLITWIRRIPTPNLSGAYNTAKTAIDAVSTAISSMIAWVKKIAEPIDFSGPFDTAKSAIDSVISAVKSLIGWLKAIKIPKISLPKGLTGRAAVAPPAAAGLSAQAAAVRVPVPLSALGRSSPAGAGIVINVNGAVDPEGTARQIRRILSGSDIRHSVTGGARGLRTV